MKPKEYIKKYGTNFGNPEFINDLTADFLSLLEVGKAKENIKGFENAVNAVRMKYNGISNKIPGGLDEKYWKYFFATVVATMREELFPNEMKRRKEEKKRREEWRQREQYWQNSGFFDNLFSSFIEEEWRRIFFTQISSFDILGLTKDSTIDDVNKKYRELVKVHHPDYGGNATEFIKITKAKNQCIDYLQSH